LNYRHEEETGLYFAGDYNLRGRTPVSGERTACPPCAGASRVGDNAFAVTNFYVFLVG
jgi:hypothetical protein